jgi:hypothetical protein
MLFCATIFQRRTAMLHTADQIAGNNESQLNSGKEKVVQTFSQFRCRLVILIGLTIGLGLLLAGLQHEQNTAP